MKSPSTTPLTETFFGDRVGEICFKQNQAGQVKSYDFSLEQLILSDDCPVFDSQDCKLLFNYEISLNSSGHPMSWFQLFHHKIVHFYMMLLHGKSLVKWKSKAIFFSKVTSTKILPTTQLTFCMFNCSTDQTTFQNSRFFDPPKPPGVDFSRPFFKINCSS